jgi:hypothetical protein
MIKKTIFASLVGINRYEDERDLDGCIKDVVNLDSFLRELSRQAPERYSYHPRYFLSRHVRDRTWHFHEESLGEELRYLEPSFDHITQNAFDHFTEAQNGDICLFYFCGHGSCGKVPSYFSNLSDNPQLETIVAVDSRSTARDILDKEIAYLIHKTVDQKPNLHFLIITDCCHSGSNTRAMEAPKPRYREHSPMCVTACFEELIGAKDSNAKWEESSYVSLKPRYVHLAACRENEKALDTTNGGLFSMKLVGLLRNGGTTFSYRQLVKAISATVSTVIYSQNPNCFSYHEGDLDMPFLGGTPVSSPTGWEIRYDSKKNSWILFAGSIHGIPRTENNLKTKLWIKEVDIIVEVEEVQDFHSILGGDNLQLLEKRDLGYQADIIELGIPRIPIGFSEGRDISLAKIAEISAAFEPQHHLYIQLTERNDTNAQLQISYTDKTYKVAPFSTPTRDIWKDKDVDCFLKGINGIGKWLYVKELSHTHSEILPDHFIFTVEKIEGMDFYKNSINQVVASSKTTVEPGDQICLSHINSFPPAIRFSIRMAEKCPFEKVHFSALYLDSEFGISNDIMGKEQFLSLDAPKLNLIYTDSKESKIYNAIPLLIPGNGSEARDYIKIFASLEDRFDFDGLCQKPLNLLCKKDRSADPVESKPRKLLKWAVFDFEVYQSRIKQLNY